MNKSLFGILGAIALLSMSVSGCSLFTEIDDPDCWPYGRVVAGDLSSDCRWPEGGDGGDAGGDAGPAADSGGPAADSGDSGDSDGGEGEGEGEGQGPY